MPKPIYVTLSELENFGTEFKKSRSSITLESALESVRKKSVSGSTFLSHSSKDKDIHVGGFIRILESCGASVYIDKKDEALPPHTSRETAEILRSRIKQCNKFILLATPNSKNSRWVPWELGVADGHKASSNTAVFAAVDDQANVRWSEQEYLGLYDRIVWGTIKGRKAANWLVWNNDKNTAVLLKEWLVQ